jgi:hypothetical protein
LKTLHALIATACLALLISLNRANAQATYSLAVSRHQSVPFSEQQVDAILAAASKMLQKVDRSDVLACNVKFKRSGPVRVFTSADAPAIIKTEKDRDTVHRVNFDSSMVNVKIVKAIGWCKPGAGVFRGCSWPENFRSLIIIADAKFPELVWPHEFGHQTGLWHREDPSGRALMSACPLKKSNVEVTKSECDCLLAGPGGCNIPEPNPPVPCVPPPN